MRSHSKVKTLRTIDLNADLGELDAAHDRKLLPWISSCNVGCGAHAGDWQQIERTLDAAIEFGTAIGAHPAFPDRAGFGRIALEMDWQDLASSVVDQVGQLLQRLADRKARLSHIKPHGALYHLVCHQPVAAEQWIELVRKEFGEIPVVGIAGCYLASLCRDREFPFVAEAFADRRYIGATSLYDREHARSQLQSLEEFSEQFRSLLDHSIPLADGRKHSSRLDTICFHGDGANAFPFLQQAKRILDERGISMAAFARH